MNWPNNKPIHFLVFSDVHTGHANTPTEDITKRMKHYIEKEYQERIPDFIFFPGDFFDRLLNVPNSAVVYIQEFIYWLLRHCKKYNTRIRILEGTPSHDWKQNYLFEQINVESQIEADLRYQDSLSIGYEADFDMNILYVPDEWHEDPKDTEVEVLQLLANAGLEKVDLAIMHGMFTFQVPTVMVGKLPAHDQEVYERIVDKLIIIGHDHKHKRSGKVVVPGSFDRLTHGEEDPKGYLSVELKPNGKSVVTFKENEKATIYKTIDLTEIKDVDEALKHIDQVVHHYPVFSNYRLRYVKGHPIGEYTAELKKKYDLVNFSKPKIEKNEEDEVKSISSVFEIEPERYSFNQYNLVDKLMEEVERRYPELDIDLARSIVNGVVKHV